MVLVLDFSGQNRPMLTSYACFATSFTTMIVVLSDWLALFSHNNRCQLPLQWYREQMINDVYIYIYIYIYMPPVLTICYIIFNVHIWNIYQYNCCISPLNARFGETSELLTTISYITCCLLQLESTEVEHTLLWLTHHTRFSDGY